MIINKKAEIVTVITVVVVALLLSVGTYTYFKSQNMVQLAPAGKCEFDKSVSEKLTANGMSTRVAIDYCGKIDGDSNANEGMCTGKVSGKSGKIAPDGSGITICKWTPNLGYGSGTVSPPEITNKKCVCDRDSAMEGLKAIARWYNKFDSSISAQDAFDNVLIIMKKMTGKGFEDNIEECNQYCTEKDKPCGTATIKDNKEKWPVISKMMSDEDKKKVGNLKACKLA